MLGENIIGNTHIRTLLGKTIEEGRISHAQLFVAPEGIGALGIAIAYACAVVGVEEKNVFSTPDIHFAYPVNTNKTIKKDPTCALFAPLWQKFVTETPYAGLNDWYSMMEIENKQGLIGIREADSISSVLSLKSFSGGYKVMIIWHGEKMNTEAANKLLKLIEEPAEKTLIIIITNDAGAILPTISSRTQVVNFHPLKEDEIATYLVEQYGIDQKDATTSAFAAEGDMGRAISIIRNGGHSNAYAELFVRFVRAAFMAKKHPEELNNILAWADEVSKLSRESQKQFISYAFEIIREALMLNYGVKELTHPQAFPLGFTLEKFAPYIHGVNISDIYNELNSTSYHIERNANAKIAFFDMAVNITRHLHARPIKKTVQ